MKSVVRIQGASRKRGEFAATLKNWKPVLGESGRAENFEVALLHQLQRADNESIAKLEKVLYEAGITEGVQVKVQEKSKPWQSDEIKGLIQERKTANTAVERRRISKVIQKSTRKALRKYGDEKTTEILKDFADLDRLSSVHRHPIEKIIKDDYIDCEVFVDLLQKVYENPSQNLGMDRDQIMSIPAFSFSELKKL